MKNEDNFDTGYFSFGQAIFLAGRAISQAKGRSLERNCLPLARLLTSDMEFGSEERELLADLLLGQMKPQVGRPTKGPGHEDIKPVLDAYFEKIKNMERKQALYEVANEFPLSERAIEGHVYEKLERDSKKHSGSHF